MAFVNDSPAKAASLVAHIQKLTDENKGKGLKAFVVFTNGNTDLREPLEKLAAEKKITVPMTFLPRGTTSGDFARYKVNPEAKNTILVYSRQKIHANLVNVDEKGLEEITKATNAMLGGQ